MNPLTLKTIGRHRKSIKRKETIDSNSSVVAIWGSVEGMWKNKKIDVKKWQKNIRNEWL